MVSEGRDCTDEVLEPLSLADPEIKVLVGISESLSSSAGESCFDVEEHLSGPRETVLDVEETTTPAGVGAKRLFL